MDNAVIETIERLLRTPSQMGLYTWTQCLEYLGSLFRSTLDAPARLTDLQVRLFPDQRHFLAALETAFWSTSVLS